MSFIRYAGDGGKRIDIGPFDTTGIVDASTITSVLLRVSVDDGAAVDWDATLTNVSTYSVTATTVTTAEQTATPGLYRMRCYFYVGSDVVLMQDTESVFRFLEGAGPAPEQPPPYDGWEARIAASEADATAAEAAATEATADVADMDARVTALEEAGSGSIPAAAYSSQVTFTESARMVYGGENGGIFIAGLGATSGFIPGTQIEWVVPAGTATAVRIALANIEDHNGSIVASFNPARDWFLLGTAESATKIVWAAQSRPALVATVPTVLSAEVDASDLDRLTVEYSEEMQCSAGSVAGLQVLPRSPGGVMALPRTVTSLVSGNGSDTHIYGLSGDMGASDTAAFVISSGKVLRALNGTQPADGATDIQITGGAVLWTPVGASLDLDALVAQLEGTSHPTAIVDGGPAAAWVDKIASRRFTQGSGTLRPIYDADGVNGRSCVDADGADDVLSSTMTLAQLIGSASTGFEVIWQGVIDAATSQASAYNTAHPLLADAGGYFALLVYNSGGTMYRARGYIFTNTTVYADCDIGATLPANGLVIEMRLDTGGTQLIVSVNGVDGTAASVTNTVSGGGDSQTLRVFGGQASVYANARARRILAKTTGSKSSGTITSLLAELS